MLFLTEGLVIAAVGAFVILAIAGVVLLIVGPYVVTWRLGRKLHQKTAQRDSRGQSIPLTTSAKFGLGNLPGDITLLSGLGRHAAPQLERNHHASDHRVAVGVCSDCRSVLVPDCSR